MPKRTDIQKILIIGSGPIVIGQAGEFDYSGTQACKALLEEGFQIILVNNNPATIMTDPEFSTRVYLEPLVPEVIEKIILKERPDALLPTVGGQTAINLAVALAESGVLEKQNVELIGAKQNALKLAEDRLLFKEAMEQADIPTLRGELAHTLKEAERILKRLGLPAVIRPSFTLGGGGGGIARDLKTFRAIVERGLDGSPVHSVLIEESVEGWKEYELEAMRDLADNVVIICSIENFDPMGVHTGDSITVAPAQTLTDREYQRMRDLAIRVMRTVGVETGGSNIQFAVHPADGRMAVIEMNPRVSRSSALASKATGFPIAKIAAKLAVGYTLDELPNDITRTTRASFEPTIDYCVVKVPRWNFEKFPGASPMLGTEMKSVGEAMAIGRTFKEALQKAIRSLEIGKAGLVDPYGGQLPLSEDWLIEELASATPERIFKLYGALKAGVSVAKIARWTHIDPWFLSQLLEIADLERELKPHKLGSVPADLLKRAKRFGFSDEQLAACVNARAEHVRQRREELGISPVYKTVDTCAAEFEARTPYLYSTYEPYDESKSSHRKKVIILGGGPYRIGQGIEFDYCCCHAAFALKELNYEAIMVNCNPETVSTDYDTSDRLYFEPVTLEDVLHIVELEKPEGLIVQYGGQTPLNLALALKGAGAPIWGTDPDQIDLAEDRGRFERLLEELDIPRPRGASVLSMEEAKRAACELGYPVLVRPSYVLGGRAMEIAYDESDLLRYMNRAVQISPRHPVLIDKFLENAIEVDVDAVADGEQCVIAGIMQHIEHAGIHSGDSCCVIPPYSLDLLVLEKIRTYTHQLAQSLEVIGLMNVQYAIRDDEAYVLEVNPRASRTVPFVSKATGIPWAKIGTWVMAGQSLSELGLPEESWTQGYAVKAPIFPFERFWVDPLLGPEMKSTGEVMGVGDSLGEAFAKTQMNLKTQLPRSGSAFISVKDPDQEKVVPIARRLHELGFELLATRGTASVITDQSIPVEVVRKLGEGHPNAIDHLQSGKVALVINTPLGKASHRDDDFIRLSAMRYGIPYVTTIEGAWAALAGIEALRRGALSIRALAESSYVLEKRSSLKP
ncbi:MAG: carbamoyl phosphate synthase large subunit [Candidatus Fraserbacteria bacterium RBG_16_55_9]|uniref:Carbamoyl phosphate synthase large chain n=1 Tax=Fraserbacteria sp. (strain RBG_16_55_9) TaxID=1817864 RepID=A0A1F5UPN9_FRAXR|nr:MAG: carbamoyl phosphate synthase large subunit [Candidatus Fraserbacteria bacterium RBG_16_55_9]